ncbi:hypothetical protein CSC94_18765 [Zhengella mangrovi]|uniref:Uncharacterized protein n=1 Tax=Zhengella mangrovi TaxID=1982044 RepID=A0A2G1QIY0_9HYPH|nr:hypothetical protein CSC94_18765 [Zhengella mangrovi]
MAYPHTAKHIADQGETFAGLSNRDFIFIILVFLMKLTLPGSLARDAVALDAHIFVPVVNDGCL